MKTLIIILARLEPLLKVSIRLVPNRTHAINHLTAAAFLLRLATSDSRLHTHCFAPRLSDAAEMQCTKKDYISQTVMFSKSLFFLKAPKSCPSGDFCR